MVKNDEKSKELRSDLLKELLEDRIGYQLSLVNQIHLYLRYSDVKWSKEISLLPRSYVEIDFSTMLFSLKWLDGI